MAIDTPEQFCESVKAAFTTEAVSALSSFELMPTGNDPRVVWLGRRRMSDRLFSFVLVGCIPEQKQFAVELAWNSGADYPWAEQLLTAHDLAARASLPQQPAGRLRIEKLWGETKPFWWSAVPSKSAQQHLDELRAALERAPSLAGHASSPTRESEGSHELITRLVVNAIRRIQEFATPFFQRLGPAATDGNVADVLTAGEFASEIVQRATEMIARRLPGFQVVPQPYADPLAIAYYRRRLAPNLTFWLAFVSARRQRGFAVEVAWTHGEEYPVTLATPNPFDAEGGFRPEILDGDIGCRLRLSQLWNAGRAFWWMADAEGPASAIGERLSREIQGAVMKIESFGRPFFDEVAKQQGIVAEWKASTGT
jgi:hypothetical protein